MTSTGWGMYGFGVEGFRHPAGLLVTAEPGWAHLDVVQRRPAADHCRPGDREVNSLRLDETSADIWLSNTEAVSIDRATLGVQITADHEVDDALLAHPYLALPIAVASQWLGRQLFHGAAVAPGGHAWGLVGTAAAGKSSLAAWFAGHGHPVLCDDLLVVDGSTVFAGPRCVDLRFDAAAALGADTFEVVGRPRRRLSLPPVAASAPLGGFVQVDWGDAVAIEPVPIGDRLRVLVENFVLRPRDDDALAYLDLVALPMYRFTRPRAIESIDAATTQLVEALDWA